MRGFLAAIGNWATKVESWLALCAMIVSSGAFTWLGNQWEALAGQGLPAVIMVAVLVSSLLVSALSLVYLAFSRPKKHATNAPLAPPIKHSATESAGVPALVSPQAPEPHPDRDVYEGAHEELMLFVSKHLLPTCHDLFRLQELAIRTVCPDGLISNFAVEGAKPRGFTEYYERLSGLGSSPAEFIPFDEMMTCVQMIEVNYYGLPNQIGLILKMSKFSIPDFIENNATLYKEWQERHRAMVEAYESIKCNPAMPKLFRPVRPSRWREAVISAS